jgi:hypothetical protein
LVPAKPVAIGPQADPDAPTRRAYELALQAGEREAWEAFLQAYPEGFYANLAKVQLRKIASEEARVAATERARLAELERARLAADGARQAELTKAAAAVKAAEEARILLKRQRQSSRTRLLLPNVSVWHSRKRRELLQRTRTKPNRRNLLQRLRAKLQCFSHPPLLLHPGPN